MTDMKRNITTGTDDAWDKYQEEVDKLYRFAEANHSNQMMEMNSLIIQNLVILRKMQSTMRFLCEKSVQEITK